MELRSKSIDNGSFVEPKSRYSSTDMSGFKSTEEILSREKRQSVGHGPHIVTHPTTFLETFMHVFKGNVGSGIFSMGQAFKNGGLIISPIVTLILGVFCVHAQHLLINAADEMQIRTKSATAPDFAETVYLCFHTGNARFQRLAAFMRKLVNIFLCITQFGFCCVYFTFIAKNVNQVADSYNVDLSVKLWMAIAFIPILFSSLVRELKYLAFFSMGAAVFMMTGIVITYYFTLQNVHWPEDLPWVAPVTSWPLYFGTALFAFEGIGLVLPLKNEMKNPQQFDKTFGVLNIGMTVVTFFYTSIGMLSYIRYGDDIAETVTLNFDQPELLANIAKLTISTGILLGYALQFYIPIEIMWPMVDSKYGPFLSDKNSIIPEMLFRCVWVFITFVIAELVPFIDLAIALIGAVSSTALALIFPPILELVICQQDGKLTTWIVCKDVLIILVGVIGFFTGTIASINGIIAKYQE